MDISAFASNPRLSLFHFYHPLRVRWAEVDPQNVVFNGHYLTYFDVAVTEYFRHLRIVYPEGFRKFSSDLYVKKSVVEYHLPARFDDELRIYVRASRIGNSSIQFVLEVLRETDLLVNGELTYVHVNSQTGQPSAVHPKLRERIERLEGRPL